MLAWWIGIVALAAGVLGWIGRGVSARGRAARAERDWQSRFQLKQRELGDARAEARQAVERAEADRERADRLEGHAGRLKSVADRAADGLEASEATRRTLEEQLDVLSAELAASHGQMNRAEMDLRQARDRAEAAEQRLAAVEARWADEEARRVELLDRVTEAESRAAQESDRAERLTASRRQELHGRDERIGLLCQQVRELEGVEADQRARLARAEPALVRVKDQRREAARRHGEERRRLEAEVAALQDELTARDGLLAELRERLPDVPVDAAAADPSVSPALPATGPATQDGPQLTDIRGIGKATARDLVRHGLGSVDELAALEKPGLEELPVALRRRIERGKWVAEARRLQAARTVA